MDTPRGTGVLGLQQQEELLPSPGLEKAVSQCLSSGAEKGQIVPALLMIIIPASKTIPDTWQTYTEYLWNE